MTVELLFLCAQGDGSKFTPAVCGFSCSGGEDSELSGLLDEHQLRKPGALVVLPDEADTYIDALLEEEFSAMAVSYEGLMRCMAAYTLSNDVSGVAFEMNAFWGLGMDDFFLAIVCNGKLRVRRITNQTHLSQDDDSQGMYFYVGNYRPYKIYSQEQIDEAARIEREGPKSPYWIVREAFRLDTATPR